MMLQSLYAACAFAIYGICDWALTSATEFFLHLMGLA